MNYCKLFYYILVFALIMPNFNNAQSLKQITKIIVNNNTKTVESLQNGTINFYKSQENNDFYIENKKLNSEITTLKSLGENQTTAINRGKLMVIFKDCISVRSKTEKSDINKARILQLIDYYNACDDYTNDFELTERQKKNQSYSKQKSIINLDGGFGYFSQNLNFQVNNNQEIKISNSAPAIFLSLNISPKHLGNLRGKLFYDFTFQNNFKTTYDFTDFKNEVSSWSLTVAPKFYFNKDERLFNPFIGASIGATVLYYNYDDKNNRYFDVRNSSDTRLIYGFQIGTTFLDKFELTLSYLPYYKFDILIGDTDILKSRFDSFSVNLGCKLNW